MPPNHTTRIPKIIHQSWKDNNVPEHWQPSHKAWQAFCQIYGFKYILWTDEMLRKLVEQYQPELLSHYDAFKHNIMRVDFARPLMLYHYGGLYCDLDIAAKPHAMASLWNFYEHSGAEVAIAKSATSGDFGSDENLTNAFMMSVAKHALWPMYWKKMIEPVSEQPWNVRLMRKVKYFEIIAGTGPHLLNRVVKQFTTQNRPHKIVSIPREFVSCGYEWDPRPFDTPESAVVLLQGSSWHSKDMVVYRTGARLMHHRAMVLGVILVFTMVFAFFLLVLLFSYPRK